MESVILSWRVQNILTIALMILAIGLVATVGGQLFARMSGGQDQ